MATATAAPTLNSAGDEPSGVKNGALLLRMVEIILAGDEDRKTAIRREVRREMGDAAFVDICATIASFDAVVKIADGAGIPLEDFKEAATRDIRAELNIDQFSG